MERDMRSVYIGGGDYRRLLRELEEYYSEAFAGCGGLADFRKMIERVDDFLDLLADPRVDFRVKLMDYAKLRADVAEFCRYYARWLGAPLMERLKAEINQLLEEVITW